MHTRAVQILFTLICLVLAAAAQELVPSFGGTKAPVLLLFALYTAFRPARRWMFVALAAGALEDALNASPVPCCTFFALLAATGAHFLRPFAWISTWGMLPPGCSVIVRFFASALPAAAAGALIFAVLPSAEHRAGFEGHVQERRPR